MRIEQKVRWFHGASDEVSGAPRILVDMRSDGEIISRKTVAHPWVSGNLPKKVADHYSQGRSRHLPRGLSETLLGQKELMVHYMKSYMSLKQH
jgi:hypothetical protein